MEVLTLTVFASLVLGLAAVLFFVWNVCARSHEHTEHLALLPLASDGQERSKTKEESQ